MSSRQNHQYFYSRKTSVSSFCLSNLFLVWFVLSCFFLLSLTHFSLASRHFLFLSMLLFSLCSLFCLHSSSSLSFLFLCVLSFYSQSFFFSLCSYLFFSVFSLSLFMLARTNYPAYIKYILLLFRISIFHIKTQFIDVVQVRSLQQFCVPAPSQRDNIFPGGGNP